MMWMNFGIERVALIGFGVILNVGLLNLFLLMLGRPSFGMWVREWARRYVVFAALLPSPPPSTRPWRTFDAQLGALLSEPRFAA